MPLDFLSFPFDFEILAMGFSQAPDLRAVPFTKVLFRFGEDVSAPLDSSSHFVDLHFRIPACTSAMRRIYLGLRSNDRPTILSKKAVMKWQAHECRGFVRRESISACAFPPSRSCDE
jgi:hypothetical protein